MKSSMLLPTYNRKKLLYNTLESYNFFYANNQDFEVVIVDDCSNNENRIDNVESDFPHLNIKFIRINQKYGFNPSLAYNVAARNASNDILILSSPETLHTFNFLDLCNNFNDFKENDYYLFSVFCLTHKDHKQFLNQDNTIEDKINFINKIKPQFYENLGCNGYDFNNNMGSWYLHEKFRPSKLNFFTAMSKNLYYEISGFNQAFMRGTGYDDTDFLSRLEPHINNYVWFDDTCAIHVDHDLSAQIPQNSNVYLFESLQRNQTYKKNNTWGILP
jgi:glycosyltransferase involved in cell wall biosynthesis